MREKIGGGRWLGECRVLSYWPVIVFSAIIFTYRSYYCSYYYCYYCSY